MNVEEIEQAEMDIRFLDEEDMVGRVEEEHQFDEGDIYCEEAVNMMLDGDEVSAAEAAFMHGYDE